MAKYIDAEALINALQSHGAICDFGLFLIEKQPAADVQKVKRGEWVHDEFDMLCCSECKEEFEFSNTTPYCPYCGAKMDGKEGING